MSERVRSGFERTFTISPRMGRAIRSRSTFFAHRYCTPRRMIRLMGITRCRNIAYAYAGGTSRLAAVVTVKGHEYIHRATRDSWNSDVTANQMNVGKNPAIVPARITRSFRRDGKLARR